jgi:hypothetical protein
MEAYRQSSLLDCSGSLMTAQKLLDIRILGSSQSFVRAAENYVSVPHHHDFTVDETEPFTFTFENNFAVVVNYRVLRTDVMQVVHLVRDED